MKYLSVLAIFFTLSTYASNSIEISSITLAFEKSAKATINDIVSIRSADGFSSKASLTFNGYMKLKAEPILVRESFVSQASMVEYMKSRLCGEEKQMSGRFFESSFGSATRFETKISDFAKTNVIFYKGANANGQKLESFVQCDSYFQ